jgi:DnaJ-class molecular chaperone
MKWERIRVEKYAHIYKCPVCKGKGKRGIIYIKECISCHGTGEIRVPFFIEEEKDEE